MDYSMGETFLFIVIKKGAIENRNEDNFLENRVGDNFLWEWGCANTFSQTIIYFS